MNARHHRVDTLRSERRANHVLYSTFLNSRPAPSTWERPSRIRTRTSRCASLRDFVLRVVESTVFDRLCWAASIALISTFFILIL